MWIAQLLRIVASPTDIEDQTYPSQSEAASVSLCTAVRAVDLDAGNDAAAMSCAEASLPILDRTAMVGWLEEGERLEIPVGNYRTAFSIFTSPASFGYRIGKHSMCHFRIEVALGYPSRLQEKGT